MLNIILQRNYVRLTLLYNYFYILTNGCVINVFRLVLLNKLLEDGNVLYRKGRLKEASHRYSYALSKFPPIEELDSTFKQLRVNFLLNHSRCKRKMQVIFAWKLSNKNYICIIYSLKRKKNGFRVKNTTKMC